MTLFDKRYTVLVGNYGSGKTELAIALAREARRRKAGRVALVDLDIVNPYFRSAEKAALLRSEGVEVLMPSFAMTTVDIPALPAEIQSVFEGDFAHVVIDAGGDEAGATALGRYAPYIAPVRAEMSVLYVVNVFRPLSGTAEDIAEMCRLIGLRARLTPDMLVNNANLQEGTTAADLLGARDVLAQTSRLTGVPVGLTTGMARLADELPEDVRARYFAFEPMMKPDWLVDGE